MWCWWSRKHILRIPNLDDQAQKNVGIPRRKSLGIASTFLKTYFNCIYCSDSVCCPQGKDKDKKEITLSNFIMINCDQLSMVDQ